MESNYESIKFEICKYRVGENWGKKKNIKVDLRLSTLNRRSIGVDIRLNLVYIVKYRESYDRSAD